MNHSSLFKCNRLAADCNLSRKRRSSCSDVNRREIVLSSCNKQVNENSCHYLELGKSIWYCCREFVEGTSNIINEMMITDTICPDPTSIHFLMCRVISLLKTVENSAKLVQNDVKDMGAKLKDVNVLSATNTIKKAKVAVKKENKKHSLSLIKFPNEALTDDDKLSSERAVSTNVAVETIKTETDEEHSSYDDNGDAYLRLLGDDYVPKEEQKSPEGADLYLQELLGWDDIVPKEESVGEELSYLDILMGFQPGEVKQENDKDKDVAEDNDSIFTKDTGLLDKLGEEDFNLDINFDDFDLDIEPCTTPKSNISDTETQLLGDSNDASSSNKSATTLINDTAYIENTNSHASSQCIMFFKKSNRENSLFREQELQEEPCCSKRLKKAVCDKKQCRPRRNRYTKEDIEKYSKMLDDMTTASDIELSASNSDTSVKSFTMSDKATSAISTKRDAVEIPDAETNTKSNFLHDSLIIYPPVLTLHPSFVLVNSSERKLCDSYLSKNNGKRKNHSSCPGTSESSDSSDELIKPLRKMPRLRISSTSSSWAVSEDSGDNQKDEDDDHNSLSLNLNVLDLDVQNNGDSNEDDIDDDEILDGIVDRFSVTSDDSSLDGKRNEGTNKKSNTCDKSKNTEKKQEVSEWKKDALLTASLSDGTNKKSDSADDVDKEETCNDAINEDRQEDVENDEEEIKIDEIIDNGIEINDDDDDICNDIYEVLSTDSSSSEIEFVDLIKKPKEASTSENSKLPGRRNIRALLSEDTLEQTTKQAEKEEKEHVERLKEKRRKLEQELAAEAGNGLVLDASGTTRIEVNPLLTKRLKPHQTKGVQFMWDACYETVGMIKEHAGSGCILAHCMGLGKTYQVAALIHTLFKYPEATMTKQVLVVCPLSTVLNWKHEFKIALDIAVEDTIKDIYTISDEQKCKSAKIAIIHKWHQTGGVLVMCYEAFVGFSFPKTTEDPKVVDVTLKALVNPGADLIICDEGHALKNDKALRTKTLMMAKTRRRIVLTGTPMQNNLKEYYYMVQFVKPNLLGTYKEYMNRFVNPIINGQYDDSTTADIMLMKQRSHVLHSILKNTIQRYEVTELHQYLPPKVDFVLFVKMHPVQVQLYKKYMELFRANPEAKQLFLHYTALRPIWVHPYIFQVRESSRLKTTPKKRAPDIQEIGGIVNEEETHAVHELSADWWKELTPEDCFDNLDYGPKLKIMISIINECEKVDDKVLIFTQYLADLDTIERFLKQTDSKWKHGVNYLRMDGRLGMEMRHKFCNKFNVSGSPIKIFLLTHRVGGFGINLAAANRVILMDVCWNPAFDSQSIFRIYRFGQTKPCYIYRLVSMGTMEEVVYERSVTKLAVAGRVVDEQQISRHYKSSELMSMYRCNLDIEDERPTPMLPNDAMLARLLQVHNEIYKYHEHQSLLENLPNEVLDEDQMKLAWEEFNRLNEETLVPEPVPVLPPVIGRNARQSLLPPGNISADPNIGNLVMTNVATALQGTSRDRVKRFNMLYVQNQQTGRKDIQLVDISKILNNTAKPSHPPPPYPGTDQPIDLTSNSMLQTILNSNQRHNSIEIDHTQTNNIHTENNNMPRNEEPWFKPYIMDKRVQNGETLRELESNAQLTVSTVIDDEPQDVQQTRNGGIIEID